jgi:hypothetical protein
MGSLLEAAAIVDYSLLFTHPAAPDPFQLLCKKHNM